MTQGKEVSTQFGMGRKIEVTADQVDLIKRTIFPKATDDELKLYIFECIRRGVHPFDRKIFPVKRHDNATGEDKVTFQTSIDLFRSESEDTGAYAGMDEPAYGDEKKDGALGYPEWAKVTVYKWITAPDGSIHRVAFTAMARWKEFYPGEKLGFMWRGKPYLMLAKCAEAQARRMAFPQKLGGLYADEEMHHADAKVSGAIEADYTTTVKEKPAQ
ncbi:MAG: phage recombination protein Bet, partial [Candidatus Omnitrophica bacterium]|nr:phage recombination protein Bet [Candidatus Omnitrophota bacterium]